MRREDDARTGEGTRPGDYILPVAAGTLLFWISALLGGILASPSARQLCRILADSTAIPGVLLTGVAVLARVSATGALAIFGYTGHTLMRLFRRDAAAVTYGEYRRTRPPARASRSWLRIGLGCLAVASVLSLLYVLTEP